MSRGQLMTAANLWRVAVHILVEHMRAHGRLFKQTNWPHAENAVRIVSNMWYVNRNPNLFDTTKPQNASKHK